MEYRENDTNYCMYCGAVLIRGGIFCKKCGNKVITTDSVDNNSQDRGKSSTPEETGIPVSENLESAQRPLEHGDIPMTETEDRENGSVSEMPEKRKKHKKLLLVNIILSLVLIIGVVSFFLVNSKMKNEFREFVADYKKEMENLEFIGEYEEIHKENLDEADKILDGIAFWKIAALEETCDKIYSEAKSFNDRMIVCHEEYENCLLDENDKNYTITSLDEYQSAKESAEKAFRDMDIDAYENAVQILSREKDAVCTKVNEYYYDYLDQLFYEIEKAKAWGEYYDYDSELDGYVQELLYNYGYSWVYQDSTLYYEAMDIDNNGILEVFIGIGSESHEGGMITLKNGEIKQVYENAGRGGEEYIGNGVFISHSSGGAADNFNGKYQYENGEIVLVEGLKSESFEQVIFYRYNKESEAWDEISYQEYEDEHNEKYTYGAYSPVELHMEKYVPHTEK